MKEVKDAVYFTIITDGTPDVSHTEKITFILRFVRFNSGKMIWEVKERFLCVEDMEKKKGADIAYLICNVLAKVNLDLQKLRGQGYVIWLQSEDPSSQDDKARQLAKFYSNDVKEDDLVEEICHFDRLKASSLFNRGNSLNLLNQIYSKGLQPIFPSICILLRIFHTMPISVAEGERSFSKLKIIKNHFRATMGQERLSNLMMLSIENDLAKSLSYDEVIYNFKSKKARKFYLN